MPSEVLLLIVLNCLAIFVMMNETHDFYPTNDIIQGTKYNYSAFEKSHDRPKRSSTVSNSQSIDKMQHRFYMIKWRKSFKEILSWYQKKIFHYAIINFHHTPRLPLMFVILFTTANKTNHGATFIVYSERFKSEKKNSTFCCEQAILSPIVKKKKWPVFSA